jgi:hypothetical protein
VGTPSTPADEADVNLSGLITDVRCSTGPCGLVNRFAGPDYAGELEARVVVRITDRDNTPTPDGPGPATVQDTTFKFTIPCSETPDTNIGSSCGVTTTADAVVPGIAKEGNRSIWQLGAVEVWDGGSDGDVDPADGDALFLTQAVYVP